TRATEDLDVIVVGAGAAQGVQRALDQLVDDEVVETRGDDGKPALLGAQHALVGGPAKLIANGHGQAPFSRRGTTFTGARIGTHSTMCSPYPCTPTIRRGLLVSRRILCTPRCANTWAPRPKSRRRRPDAGGDPGAGAGRASA